MKLSANAAALVANARFRIRKALDGGAILTVSELPRRWPETRLLFRQLLDGLIEEGAVAPVAFSRAPGRAGFRITPRVRTWLRGQDEAAD